MCEQCGQIENLAHAIGMMLAQNKIPSEIALAALHAVGRCMEGQRGLSLQETMDQVYVGRDIGEDMLEEMRASLEEDGESAEFVEVGEEEETQRAHTTRTLLLAATMQHHFDHPN